MNGFSRLALVEGKLFLREKAALIGVFGLPVALVIGFGLIPGFSNPQKGLSDQIGTEYIAALGVAIVLARLGVTPVRPLSLLLADLTVWAAAALVSVAVVIAVVRIAFHVPAPVKPGWFILAVALGIASLFATGLLAASVAPTARGAAGIGWLLLFPNMFLSGIYFPTEEMSATMRQIGNFTPLGSALHAVRDSWMGIDPRPEYLGIMAAWALVAGALAARFFRWDQA